MSVKFPTGSAGFHNSFISKPYNCVTTRSLTKILALSSPELSAKAATTAS
jgi:hypothetical protein